MKLRKILQLVATCVGVILVASGAYAGYISTQSTVEPGKWTSDYDGAMAYAEKNNIPMIVFWANVGCGNCEKIEKEMNNSEDFQNWKDQLKALMVFVESNSTVKKWIKANARTKISKYPYMAVYWPKNAAGEEVLEGFSAYKGEMSLYGASSKDTNVKQIMDTVNYLLTGWAPGSDVPEQPAVASYTVTFVVDSDKGVASGSLTQSVEEGKNAQAPEVTAKEGWKFDGWDVSFGNVTSDLVVTAQFSAVAIEPDPEPVYYAVTFVVDPAKGTAEGSLTQSVKEGTSAEAPVVTAKDGWEFDGWDRSFSKVASDLTITAKFVEPVERDEIDPAVLFKKSKKLESVVYMDGVPFGKLYITLGKYNAKKDYLKATFKISAFSGKSYTKSVNVTPDKFGDILDVDVAFKSPVGTMEFDIVNGEDGFEVYGEGDDYYVEEGDVVLGGLLESEDMTFSASFEEIEPEKESFDFILDPSVFATAVVKKGKTLSFGSAPSIKYKKFREDGETWYELAEYDMERYPNENGVKISYKYKTGAFSGSFKIYASNESSVDEGKKPTIKKYTAKFSGCVVNGEGLGTVTVKIGKKTYTGTCSLQ